MKISLNFHPSEERVPPEGMVTATPAIFEPYLDGWFHATKHACRGAGVWGWLEVRCYYEWQGIVFQRSIGLACVSQLNSSYFVEDELPLLRDPFAYSFVR